MRGDEVEEQPVALGVGERGQPLGEGGFFGARDGGAPQDGGRTRPRKSGGQGAGLGLCAQGGGVQRQRCHRVRVHAQSGVEQGEPLVRAEGAQPGAGHAPLVGVAEPGGHTVAGLLPGPPGEGDAARVPGPCAVPARASRQTLAAA